MRGWRRNLVSAMSLLAYFVANTPATLAMDCWSRGSSTPSQQKHTSQKPRKCKHCSHTFSTPKPKRPVNKPCDSGQPCSPSEPCQKDCPCPAGCAVCSVAKAACLNSPLVEFEPTALRHECCVDQSFDYVSPFDGGLIRPPRVGPFLRGVLRALFCRLRRTCTAIHNQHCQPRLHRSGSARTSSV